MTKPLIRLALAGLGLTALASCAPYAAPEPSYVSANGRPCFAVGEVHNFKGPDSGPIYIRARVSEVFELTTAGCPGFNFANSLNIEPDSPSNQLCVGDRARIMPSGAGTAGVVCAVQVTRKLTPQQAADLPDSYQP